MQYSDNNSVTTLLPEELLTCTDGESCAESINLSCFTYSGNPIIIIGTSSDKKLSTILQKIETLIHQRQLL